jgi:branched-chain amino acid transport system ATP-binding protein
MRRLAQLLVDLRARGIAIVVIEHHMDLIMTVADHIVVIDQGRRLAEGPPAAIQKNPAVLEAYLGRPA